LQKGGGNLGHQIIHASALTLLPWADRAALQTPPDTNAATPARMTPSYRVQARANQRQRLASNLRPHIVGEI